MIYMIYIYINIKMYLSIVSWIRNVKTTGFGICLHVSNIYI